MGFGLPASIGAQLGNPDLPVICISGDGGFQMNIQELATISNNNLPIKIIIFNNGTLGMVRQWQELFFNERYSHTLIHNPPDFVKIAQAYDIKAIKINQKKDVEKAIKEALNFPGPMLLDFAIPQDENVFPMVPEGASLEEMLDYKNVLKETEI